MTVTKGLLLLFPLLVSQFVLAQEQDTQQKSHNDWLRNQFAEKHQGILPKVAVADMFYGCNLVRKSDPVPYQVNQLIEKMDKGILAEKLQACLGDENANSDNALNFGLTGCFTDQLSALPKEEQAAKMALVENAINRLSREERQKSFTKCVTKQAIRYIK